MTKITIVISKLWFAGEGLARPPINWGNELSRRGHDVCLLLVGCQKGLVEHLRGTGGTRIEPLEGWGGIPAFLERENPDFVLIDDYYPSLEKFMRHRRGKARVVIYAETLFGIHSLSDIFSMDLLRLKERLLYGSMRLLPFAITKPAYCRLMKKGDIIAANSQSTASLLHVLYGIEPDGVVLPPVDTSVFTDSDAKKKRQVLLYLGSNSGDTSHKLAGDICRVAAGNGFRIIAVGNRRLAAKLGRDFAIEHVHGVSDRELAKAYSESMLTICPQKWELFGYVPAESICCGTPVLAFNCLGPAETVRGTGFGALADNSLQFLRLLGDIDALAGLDKKSRARMPFDSGSSTEALERLLLRR